MTDLSWHRARDLAHASAPALPPRPVPLDAALGLPLAVDLVAGRDLPHYASSAMDGFVVAGAGPWRLRTAGHAADETVTALADGDAAPIVTGGAVPRGATAVLRSEHAHVDGTDLIATGPVTTGTDIRPAGEEARAGDLLVPATNVLTPAQIALAAVTGFDELTVLPAPTVTVLLTGDEVITAGIPAAGQVRDAFGPQLSAVLAALGGRTTSVQRLPDRREPVTAALTAAEADVVVTTGGTGRSRADHVRAALLDLGAELIIDGIDVRPGHPAVLARLRDGGPLVIALPGNPLAAMLTMLTLTEPVLAGLRGRPLTPPTVGRLTTTVGPGRSTRLIPATRAADGGVAVRGRAGSGMLSGLALADVVLVIPAGGLPAGREVECLALPWRRRRVDVELVHRDAAAPASGGAAPAANRPTRIEGPREYVRPPARLPSLPPSPPPSERYHHYSECDGSAG